MNKINVLMVSRFSLSPEYLPELAKIDPRIQIKDAIAPFARELRANGRTGRLVDRLYQQQPAGNANDESLDDLLAEAEVIMGTALFPDDLKKRCPNLKWIHLGTVGIDFLPAELLTGEYIITNSRGVEAKAIAEHVMMFLFMLAKDARRILRQEKDKKWFRFVNTELGGKVLGIIGLGAIGSEVVQRAKCMGMKVIATRRSAQEITRNTGDVDVVYPTDKLHEMLGQTDFLVLACPLTDATRGMIGEAELDALKASSYLINIARGPIVDETALIRALQGGKLAGAGLDVLQQEPPPPDNPLWDMPNVILSPHMAGSSDHRPERLLRLFSENLKRYLSNETLINQIDLKKRY